MSDTEIDAAARLIFETGLLKLSKRTGWWLCGVKDPESIADCFTPRAAADAE